MKNLTPRELEVVALLSEGLTNVEIAKRLYLSVHTIKSNLENIYDKLSVHNRVQLAILYVKELELKS